MSQPTRKRSQAKAWVNTGPTSGIGHRTALELAKLGTVVLVGRSRSKLDAVQKEIQTAGGHAVSVICDLSDITSARRAAAEIAALDLPIAGVLNNAGIMPMNPFKSAQGWDGTYATDHLGPVAFTEALIPCLPDRANVVFVVSAVEDPERKTATMAGFCGGRYISAAASASDEWLAPGGSKLPGGDAYATAKQGNLAAVLAFARETPRLRFNAVEPGFSPGSNLGRDANVALCVDAGDGCDGCCAPTGPVARDEAWLRASRLTRALSWFSLAWMTAEGTLGLLAGVAAGSISLTGWAVGSVIEGLASVIVVWRFTGSRTLSDTAEHHAQRGVAVSFFLLAPYIAVQASHDLWSGHVSTSSTLGIIVTASSLILMPMLGGAKKRLGRQLHSAATAGEGAQNLLCATQAAAVLIGLGAVALFGWTFIDPVVGLALAGWAIFEGRRAWRGERCC